MGVIKLLPPLVINQADADRIADSLDDVVGASHKLGAVWDFGRTLSSHAMKTRTAA